MQRLPKLVFERDAWRLPITDVTASVLLAVLCADAPEASSRLESALVADPLLTTWFAFRAREFDNVTFGSLNDLVAWLNRDRLIAHLDWRDASDAAPLPADATTLASWRHLASNASRFLTSQDGVSASRSVSRRAYYRRALSCGAKWFGSCCQPSLGSRNGVDVDGQALDRIANRFNDIGASVMASDLTLAVPFPADAHSANAPADDAVDRLGPNWSNSQLVAPLLPSLVAQLRRLAKLEGDFERAVEQQKLLAMKELAYGASHEINNPLANISARAQTLLVGENDPGRRKKLAAINRSAFRAHEMIADMMLFAKPPRMSFQSVQVTSIVDEVVRGLGNRLIECQVRVEKQMDGLLPEIIADPTQLTVALRAIVQNAIEAIQEDGLITISAEVIGVPPNRRAVTLRVQDSGPGIPDLARLHIFDPFFSGREAGRGLGFGLSKAWRIVHEHGGRLDVENVPGCGTVFTMRVPSQVGQFPGSGS